MKISTKRAVQLIVNSPYCPFKKIGMIPPARDSYLENLNAFRKYNPEFRAAWNRALIWAKKESNERHTFELAFDNAPKAVKDRFPFVKTLKSQEQRKHFFKCLQEYYEYKRLPDGFGKGNLQISL